MLDKEALLKKRGGMITSRCGEFTLDDLDLRVSQPERVRLVIVEEPTPVSVPKTEVGK
jgi:hypothetical protein